MYEKIRHLSWFKRRTPLQICNYMFELSPLVSSKTNELGVAPPDLSYSWIFIRIELKPRLHCPGVRSGACRQFVARGLGRTGTNREEIRLRSYIPGSTTDQTRFGAKSDQGLSRLCYGLRRCNPGVAPKVRPDTPRLYLVYRRHGPGATTISHRVARQSPGVTR